MYVYIVISQDGQQNDYAKARNNVQRVIDVTLLINNVSRLSTIQIRSHTYEPYQVGMVIIISHDKQYVLRLPVCPSQLSGPHLLELHSNFRNFQKAFTMWIETRFFQCHLSNFKVTPAKKTL